MAAPPVRRGRISWSIGLAAALVAAAVLAAWALQSRYADGAGSSQGDPAPSYSIKVTKDGSALKDYDLASLRALPQTRIVIDGKEQSGPLLIMLLEDAGAGEYDSVVVRGAGLRDNGSLTLTAAQAGRRVQIDFSDRGTVKVCGPDLHRVDWVRDVLTIDAR